MGKLKQSVIDTPQEDLTDPSEPDFMNAVINEAEISVGHDLFNIDTSISRLEKLNLGANPDELRAFADRLVTIATKIERPF